MPSKHTHTHRANENKQIARDDLYVVTLQIVLEEKKEKKKTKTCGVFLDSACGCCKKQERRGEEEEGAHLEKQFVERKRWEKMPYTFLMSIVRVRAT